MPFIVPGIGYAGLGQQTAAAQQVFRQAMGGRTSTRSATRSTGARRRRPKKSAARRATKRRASARGNKFTKGSAAAKRHMAKLRKMRKR